MNIPWIAQQDIKQKTGLLTYTLLVFQRNHSQVKIYAIPDNIITPEKRQILEALNGQRFGQQTTYDLPISKQNDFLSLVKLECYLANPQQITSEQLLKSFDAGAIPTTAHYGLDANWMKTNFGTWSKYLLKPNYQIQQNLVVTNLINTGVLYS